MKSTRLEVNIKTGEQTYKEVELTKADIVEMEKQQQISKDQQRLSEIVNELNQDDWKTIKRMENCLSDEEWNVHIDKRARLRDEHNAITEKMV